MMKKRYSLLAILLVVWACLPGFVSAHAYIYQSSPLANAVLDSSPSQIKLTFTEKIDTKMSSISLENSAGGEVKGTLSSDGDQTLILTIPKLEQGVYKVKWQVLSLDTHVTDGSFQFSIGVELETKPPDDTASLDGGSVKPPATAKPSPSAVITAPPASPAVTPKPPVTPPPASPAKQEPSAATGSASSAPTPTLAPASTQDASESAVPTEPVETDSSLPNEPTSGETPEIGEDGGLASEPSDAEPADTNEAEEASGVIEGVTEPPAASGESAASAASSSGEEHNHAGGHTLMIFLRIAEVLAALAAGGILFFRYALWRSESSEPPAGFSLRAEQVVIAAAAIIWIASGWSRIDMLASQFSGIAWNDILSQTMVGKVAFMRPAAAIIILLLAFAPKREAVWANPVKWLLAAGIIVTFPLTGHAYAAAEDAMVAIIAHSVHMGTAAVWFGGLTGLWMLTYRPDGSGTLLRAGDKFAMYALPSIVLIIISGVWLTLDHLSSWSQLWGSDYGRLALVKILLLLLVVGIAAVHRLLRAKASGERALIWGVRAEIVAAVALIVFAGWLSTTSPPPYSPPNAAREPVYWHVMGDNAHMTLRINESKDGTQVVKLDVWLREDQGEPDELLIEFVPETGDAAGTAVFPVEMQEGGSDPFGFPGFNKYSYTAEGAYIGAAEDGRLKVSFKDKSGETFSYEKPLNDASLTP
ncbi:hypothetical protein D3P07_12830 [Paenibacillus sp. 1011MAR3C5]|uniref:copper resistance CopC/CopD family protein n=1 Tax=Paenibacillus sp. 1011MAR3C5 TaxID=1675787 RepID=UPI000E6C5560|nr:copper resistance protein CopC [Paenibacillus sp. 1011MAR3C5]RJE88849.1 hypothetical protein D3P07_12830 [Paenibacillus sp. 1011MAR3C5]